MALPDALDLLVACVEAGMGLNQALARVAEEVRHMSSAMSEELSMVNLEIRAGTPRNQALHNLGDRSDLGDIRALVTKRRQVAEEAAAKTTIKLVFPLVFFVFPALFVVILSPAVIQVVEQLLEL